MQVSTVFLSFIPKYPQYFIHSHAGIHSTPFIPKYPQYFIHSQVSTVLVTLNIQHGKYQGGGARGISALFLDSDDSPCNFVALIETRSKLGVGIAHQVAVTFVEPVILCIVPACMLLLCSSSHRFLPRSLRYLLSQDHSSTSNPARIILLLLIMLDQINISGDIPIFPHVFHHIQAYMCYIYIYRDVNACHMHPCIQAMHAAMYPCHACVHVGVYRSGAYEYELVRI